MKLKPGHAQNFYAQLRTAGMPEVPGEFSVVPQHQVIPTAILAGISDFIHCFDRVTAREAWQAAALREAPALAQLRRPEVCFFSAWDFHLPPGSSWQLIEFNDNGSGFIFAAIINALYYEAAGLGQEQGMAAPARLPAFNKHIGDLVEQEAQAFFGEHPAGLFLVLDDAQSLHRGKFRKELQLLCDLLYQRGWQIGLGCPAELRWEGQQLLLKGQTVSFVVNRSTDFFWQSEDFSALRAAYHSGWVYVAPNPFTYATRSDKRLLEWLSLPDWDKELGIEPRERAPGLTHRIGGIERNFATSEISYDSANHQKMTDTRKAKIDGIANFIPEQDVSLGAPGGKLAVVGWGSTFGAIQQGVRRARAAGGDVSHIHIRHLWPLPRNLGTLLRSYERILVPEMNTGQLKTVLRDQYLVDAKSFNKVSGQPFRIAEIDAAIQQALA